MMIVMREDATPGDVSAVVSRVESTGARAHVIEGEAQQVIGVVGDVELVRDLALEVAPGVDHTMPISRPFKLASSQVTHGRRTVIDIAGRKIGGDHFATIAGPCTVESRDVMLDSAHAVKDAGAQLLRGGAYKPRTSPYSFQGLGEEGLKLLAEAKQATGMPIVTEVMDVRDLEAVCEVADMIQLGARSMQNYTLLTEIGRSGVPVLIKRGLSATLEELLMAAEYVLKEGNGDVVLCERGIRTFETAYRFTLDLMAVPVLKELTHLPGDRRSLARRRAARPGRVDVHGRRRGRRRRADRGGPSRPRPRGLRWPPAAAGRRRSPTTWPAWSGWRRWRARCPRRPSDRLRDVHVSQSKSLERVRDQRIARIAPLATPHRLLTELPLTPEQEEVVISGREQVSRASSTAPTTGCWWWSARAACTTPRPPASTPRGWPPRPRSSATTCWWPCACTSRSRAPPPAGRA